MLVTFVSNYINHHQIPICNELDAALEGRFCFIQTQAMEEERVRMGWNGDEQLPYVKYYYEEPELCQALIMDSKVVIFGGTDEESYIAPRLKAGKPVFRYSERLYKTGQWKAVSPRGLRKKYLDHTRYQKSPVYLLCAGAYVPSDYHLVRAYTGKMYRWGYFPEFCSQDVDKLLQKKDRNGSTLKILWAARFIDWKHPEMPVRLAAYLKEKKIDFQLEMIGGGPLEESVRQLIRTLQVEDRVTLSGYRKPGEVRASMEQADVYLVTSDRQEGWGAVVNEAMNSGCAVVANHMIGAVPYLIEPERNGRIYYDRDENMLFRLVEELAVDRQLCRQLGRSAYETIAGEWNPVTAARRLLGLMAELGMLEGERMGPVTGPCSPAPVIGERAMKRLLAKRAAQNRAEV